MLTPGQTYWLLIDGSSGATCSYTITFVSGIELPGLTEDLTTGWASPASVCQGYNGLELNASPQVGNAHGYMWTLGWNGQTVTSTLPQHSVNIPPNTPPGDYEVCVRAFSGCDTMDFDICFPVEVYEIPDAERPEITLCPEEFPVSWGPLTITGPGTYNRTFTTPQGCTYDSSWMVNQYPIVPVGHINVLECSDSYTYEVEIYYNSGDYTLQYPNQGLNGCDSTAILHLTLGSIEAEIDVSCDNQEYILTPIIFSVIPNNAPLHWEWYNQNDDYIDDAIPLRVLNDGTYKLKVTLTTVAGDCVFEYITSVTFDSDDYVTSEPSFPPEYSPYVEICAESGVFFEAFDNSGQPVEYTWSSTPSVPIYQDGTSVAEFDFSNAGPTIVCVFTTNECGDGPPACFNVEIIPTPVATFNIPSEICAGEDVTLTFTGSASANSEITWDFGGATVVSGSGLGPYTLSWATTGNKLITLSIVEPGCAEAYESQLVVVSTLQTPAINCSSTINSVTFDWTDVPGVTGYLVSINGGPTFSTGTTSEHMEGGLTPGQQVMITVTVEHPGPCVLAPIMHTCTAADCPPPVVEIIGPDSVCLNAPQVYDLEAVVNGSPGVGVWSGNGIIDANAGLFDPRVSGAGQHQVLFAVDINDCITTTPYVIEVFDSLMADFTIDPLVMCVTDEATLTYTGNGTSLTSYNYTFGTANVVSGSGEGPYRLRWGTPGQKTVRLQVSENGCISDVITRTVEVSPELIAANINCAPNTSGVLFSWTTDASATGIDVNTLTGHSGVLAGNTLEFTGLTAGDIVEIEVVTYSGGPCPDRRDTLSCEARECPQDSFTITPVADVCLYPGTLPIQLGVTVTGGTGTGTGAWSGPGITNPVQGIFDPVIAGAGTHQLIYHYADDGCDFYPSLTVRVYDPPQAYISNTNLTLTCTSSSLYLDGSGSSGGPLNYAWSTTDGSLLSGTNQAVAEVGSAGTYTLHVTHTVSGCSDEVSVTVDRDASIPDAIGGEDKTLTCEETSVILGGASSTGPHIVYQWTTVNGNIIGSSTVVQITADRTGDYTLTVRDTSNGCQATDVVSVDIDTAVATLTLLPGDIIDCDTPLSDVESTLGGPVVNYSYSWSTTDGRIEGSTTGEDIRVSQGGHYTLVIRNLENGCERTASAEVEESDEIINGVDVHLTHVVCYGQHNGALVINGVEGGTPPYTYQWSVNAPDDTALSSLGPGQYSLTVTDQHGCTYSRVFNLTQPEQVTVDVGPNKIVAAGDEVGIDLTTNVDAGAIGQIVWSPYDGQGCAGCHRFEFIATTSSTITVMVSDTAGCSALDSMRLTVIVPRIFYVPTVFSPNGDNINDYFTIFGRPNLTRINYLRIFDRWGNQLFDKPDLTPGIEQEGWNGKFRDQPVQPGVYVYMAELQYDDGESEVITGDITLVR